jgi:hypothetical protein
VRCRDHIALVENIVVAGVNAALVRNNEPATVAHFDNG